MTARKTARESVVRTHSVVQFAEVSEFERKSGEGGRVKRVVVDWGGHTDLVRTEGVIDVVGEFANLSRP